MTDPSLTDPAFSGLLGSSSGARAGRVHAPNQRALELPGVPPCSPVTDINGAADYLSTSVRHVRQMVFERRIPFIKLGDTPRARVRFSYRDLDGWLAANRVEQER